MIFACNDFLAYDIAIALNAWCFNKDGTLKKGDWAGDINDTNNAMDDLLKSDKFNNGRVPDVSMVENITKTAIAFILVKSAID